jgi:hypothetical protein
MVAAWDIAATVRAATANKVLFIIFSGPKKQKAWTRKEWTKRAAKPTPKLLNTVIYVATTRIFTETQTGQVIGPPELS